MTFRRWHTLTVIDETHTWLAAQSGPSVPSPVDRAFAAFAEQVNATPHDPRQLQPLPEWVTTPPSPRPPNPLVRREVRESLDGVLAVRDPRRTGVRGRPWLVIDAPLGHLTHWRDQLLSAVVVQDWTVLTPAPRPAPQEQP
jgi:hypothetical protein